MVQKLIDELKKIFEFESFSHVRICFTPTTIIFKWRNFNKFPLYIPIEKSMVHPEIYDFSHLGGTNRSCKQLNLRCSSDKLCKKIPPVMYVHCTYILVFFCNSCFTHVLHQDTSVWLLTTSVGAVEVEKVVYLWMYHRLFYGNIYIIMEIYWSFAI